MSRQDTPERQVIVYDYHLLTIGLAYSDCRNVATTLAGPALTPFWETYGPVDQAEAVLDAPIAVLHGLRIALQLPRLPAWGYTLRQEITDGAFQHKLQRALDSHLT